MNAFVREIQCVLRGENSLEAGAFKIVKLYSSGSNFCNIASFFSLKNFSSQTGDFYDLTAIWTSLSRVYLTVSNRKEPFVFTKTQNSA